MLAEIAMWVLFALIAVLALGLFSRWLLNNPRQTVDGGLIFHAVRIYSRLFHHLRVEGREHIPRDRHPGPLIVVMNHTAGVDPVLVQAACPFFVRYVMAEDMRLPRYEWLWKWATVIFVDRVKRTAQGTREALRHLAEGGVLGIFPEGGLERPPCHILPFEPGIGLIVRRTGARVLPVVIDGTPQVDPAWASLWTSSHSRLRFMQPISYRGSKLSAGEIAGDLQRRFASWTGWPMLSSENAAEATDADVEATTDGRSTRRQPAAGAA
jgi:1-acyl-sn-glycerol-3-phosphate acyltransferase